MPVRESDLIGFTRFKGADNVSREDSLPDGAVRSGQNVDFDQDGRARRRAGYTEVRSGTRMHSILEWNNGAVWCENGSILYAPDEEWSEAVTLVTGLDVWQRVSWTEIDESLYWSNSETAGRISDDLSTEPWGLAAPDGLPIVTAGGVGGFGAGRYQFAMTYIDAAGRESGAPLSGVLDVGEGEAIQLASIPQPAEAAVTHIAFYLSERDGENLYYHSQIAIGTSSVNLLQRDLGELLESQFMDRLPPGHIVRYANGRLYSAAGSILYYSQPHDYGRCRIHEDYHRFSSRLTLCEPIADGEGSGMFVSDGKRTHYIAGSDPETAQHRTTYPHGAVEGTSAQAPGSDLGLEYSAPVPFWLATDGRPVAGLPGGGVAVLNRDFVADDYERGASIYREHDSIKQLLIAVQHRRGTSSLAAQDTAVAEVIPALQMSEDGMPTKKNLDLYQGAIFQKTFRYKNKSTGAVISLVGFTARMQVRETVGSDSTVFDLTSAAGDITFPDAANGEITITITAAASAAIDMNHQRQRWKYDLEIDDGAGDVRRILEGTIIAHPEVTR